MHGEHDDLGVRNLVANLLGCRHTVHHRHGQIHQHDFGAQLRCSFDRFEAIGRLADDLVTG